MFIYIGERPTYYAGTGNLRYFFFYLCSNIYRRKRTMNSDNFDNNTETDDNYMVLFFAGGETRDDKFNVFTGSFIRLMKKIFGNNFDFIRGIYYKSALMNVIWALNNAQQPLANPDQEKIVSSAFNQIVSYGLSPEAQLIITSSSFGSIVAAQTACYLAEKSRNNIYFRNPFHIVLGASMISSESDLFRQLIHYQKDGIIGSIIHDEIQDMEDNSRGVGGLSRFEAYRNAFGLLFPWLSGKFSGPSFLNTDAEKGHIHRRRSQTVQKAIDYIYLIFIKNKLAGDRYRAKAVTVVENEIGAVI